MAPNCRRMLKFAENYGFWQKRHLIIGMMSRLKMGRMKKIVYISILLLVGHAALAQKNLTGQWKGYFVDKSSAFMNWGGDRCEYVLELECKGRVATGFSYTYFNDGGKRYYTICRLKGTVSKEGQYVEVTEVERTKTNVPINIRNCFQIHRLTFYKEGNDQVLSGSWVPAPNQEGDCGYGSTTLARRVMQQSFPGYNRANARNTPRPIKGLPDLRDKNKATAKTPPAVAKKLPVKKDSPVALKRQPTTAPVKQPMVKQPTPTQPVIAQKDPLPAIPSNIDFAKRNNSLLKTIEVENETFRVDLYDNGEIDGDSISLLYNGKLLLQNKRLTDKALTLNLTVKDNAGVNELVMYAENLGSIPPNTALMVVTDGNNRYEVRITSDTQKNGTIRFVHRPKTQ
jgi:hypothetical protein